MSQRQQSETTGDRRATGGADSRAAATADVVFGILAGATNRNATPTGARSGHFLVEG